MKYVSWVLLLFLSISCATEKPPTYINNLSVGVHTEPLDSIKKIDSWVFQDTLIWIATSEDGSQISFTTDSVLWCRMYDHQLGRFESLSCSQVQSNYYPDSIWTLESKDLQVQIQIHLHCGTVLKNHFFYKKRPLVNLKLELLIPSRYHDIYVLEKHNQLLLRDWKNFSQQVTFEINSTEKYIMMYGKCGYYRIPFQYHANNYFCLDKSSPPITPCHSSYSEVELAATIQQRLLKIKREGMYLQLIVPGDTLTFLKID